MAVRLTKFIREQILNALLKHSFEAREKDLNERKQAFAKEIYNDVYPPKVRAAMAALPAGFLPTCNGLKVSFEGGRYTYVYFGERLPIARDHECYVAKVYPPEHPFAARFIALDREEKDLKREKDEAKNNAKAVLESVTTVKKLIDLWPEVETFARPYAAESTSRAVALPTRELNARLGLPPA
ncbi:MAG: Nmad5 family putative nucleotide modification protein [Methanomethylophilus sp.]